MFQLRSNIASMLRRCSSWQTLTTHTWVISRCIRKQNTKSTKKGNLQSKKKKKKGKNQVLRGGGVMCSKNITQLVKGACQALHTE